MNSTQVLTAALGAACLLVACLIVVVLRHPAPARDQRPSTGDAEAHTLARIYAVQPAPSSPSQPALVDPSRQTRLPTDDPAPPGRMPGMPASSPRLDERNRALLDARIPAGPLPFERTTSSSGWGNGPMSLNGRLASGELPMLDLAAGVAGMPFSARPAADPGFPSSSRSDGTIGRMPGFAVAEQSPLVVPSRPDVPTEQRRLGALTRVYAEGIQVAYDPTADAIDILFAACPMHSPAEVTLVFRVLLAKVRTVLKPLGRDRAALLIDTAGLEIGADIAPIWGGSLREFLAAACELVGPGQLLIARYSSRGPSPGNQQESLQRIQSTTPAAAQGLQSAVLGSREEAAALLARLRQLATLPGS